MINGLVWNKRTTYPRQRMYSEEKKMKPALIIGSTCVDVVLKIDRLPKTGDDLQPKSQTFTVGGCAYNVSQVFRLLKTPHTLITPVGGGVFGEYVRNYFEENDIPITVHLPEEENGCCYCLVEADGERTFLAYHGVEYAFRERWMDPYQAENYGWVYICGMEIGEADGWDLIRYLKKYPQLKVCYAPGPCGVMVDEERVEELYRLHPMLHLNEREAGELTGEADYARAARKLSERTGNHVIITLGEKGAYCLEENGSEYLVPAEPVETVVDTIGAGDVHVGTVLAGLTEGWSLREAIAYANKVSAAVVGVRGATLTKDNLPEI